MRTAWLLVLLLASGTATAQTGRPFVVGEWAGDCKADYRIGYRLAPDGALIAYTVNRGAYQDFGKPVIRSENAEFFLLDFNDGGPPVLWKKAGQTIRPWAQGENGSIIKDGIREGAPTPTFQRCR